MFGECFNGLDSRLRGNSGWNNRNIKLICIAGLVILLFTGCAHFDPSVLETADAIDSGLIRREFLTGSTQDIGAWIDAPGDTLWGNSLNLRKSFHTRGAGRHKISYGLGDNMELIVSGQVNPFSPGDHYFLNSLEFGYDFDLGYMAKFSLKKVWNPTPRDGIAILPTWGLVRGASTSNKIDNYQFWTGYDAVIYEMPIVYSHFWRKHNSSMAANLTLRPGYTSLERDFRKSLSYSYGPYAFHYEYTDSRPERAELYRLAMLCGMKFTKSKVYWIFELGCEAAYSDGTYYLMPIAAFSTGLVVDPKCVIKR